MSAQSYWCGGCRNEIYPQHIRLECKVCVNYSSCMSCQLLGTASGPHQTSHPIYIIQPSQHPAPAAPACYSPRSYSSSPAHHHPHFYLPAYPHSPAPPPPPPPQTAEQYWGTLITPEKTASPMLCALLDAAFTYLDKTIAPINTGYLEPEKYSAFVEALGWGDSALTKIAAGIYSDPVDMLHGTDTIAAACYMQYSMDHRMVTRPMPQGADVSSWEVIENGMPLLSSLGKESLVLEIMANPEDFSPAFNRLLSTTPLVHPATGMPFKYLEIPRGCFPTEKDPDVVRRDTFAREQWCRFIEDMRAQEAARSDTKVEEVVRDIEAEAVREAEAAQDMMQAQLQEQMAARKMQAQLQEQMAAMQMQAQFQQQMGVARASAYSGAMASVSQGMLNAKSYIR